MLLSNFPTLISTLKNTHVGRNAFGGGGMWGGSKWGFRGGYCWYLQNALFATGHNIIKCVKFTRSMP